MFNKKTIALALSASTAVAINTHRIGAEMSVEADSTDYCSMASSDCQEFCYKGMDAIGDDEKKKAAAEKWFCDNDVITGQCLIKSKELVDKYDDEWKSVADDSIQKATNEMCMCQSVKDEIKNDSPAGKAWKVHGCPGS